MLNHSYFVEPTKEEMAIVEKLRKTIYRKCGVNARCENCKFFTPNHIYVTFVDGGFALETWCNKFQRHVTPSMTYCTLGGEKDGQ